MIPADVRRQLSINEGDTLHLRVRNGEIILATRADAIRRAQKLFLSVDPSGDWTSELMEERRAEAGSEVAG